MEAIPVGYADMVVVEVKLDEVDVVVDDNGSIVLVEVLVAAVVVFVEEDVVRGVEVVFSVVDVNVVVVVVLVVVGSAGSTHALRFLLPPVDEHNDGLNDEEDKDLVVSEAFANI